MLIERFADYPDENELLERVRATWPSAYEVRGEERLRGIGHYMSPKVWLGQYGFTMYHCCNRASECWIAQVNMRFVPFPDFAKYTHKSSGLEKCSNVANAK